MATFTAEQIGMAAWNAGFRDEPTLARAIAVALAESSGRTDAHNPDRSTGDDSYGLWQINMLGAMGPARRKVFGLKANAELLDPQKNAAAAWAISNKGKNWAAWSTFKNGAYVKHMPAATAAAKSVLAKAPRTGIWTLPGAGAVADVADAVGSVQDMPGAIATAANNLSQGLFKLGVGLATATVAVILLILGVVILLRSPLKSAAGTVAGVVPGGKVAAAAGKAAKIL